MAVRKNNNKHLRGMPPVLDFEKKINTFRYFGTIGTKEQPLGNSWKEALSSYNYLPTQRFA